MAETMEEVAAAADRVADEQRQVARQARSMQRQHERGRPWSEILEAERPPRVIDLLRQSRQILGAAATRVTVVLARELSAEGQTRRQIAERLGVTHQRVTTVLHRHRQDDE